MPNAEGNVLRTEGKKFSRIIDDASHYLFCYALKSKQKN